MDVEADKPVTAITFGPSSRQLAFSAGPEIYLRALPDPDESERILHWTPPEGDLTQAMSLDISPDGRWLAANTTESSIWLWDLEDPTPEPKTSWRKSPGGKRIVFSPDGHWLARAPDGWGLRVYTRDLNPAGDFRIPLWSIGEDSLERNAPPVLLAGHTWAVTDLAFGPDGSEMASVSWDRTVRLWDLMAKPISGRVLYQHTDELTRVAFDPEGRRLAAGGADGVVLEWRDPSREEEPRFLRSGDAAVSALAYGKTSNWLAAGTDGGKVLLLDLTDAAAGVVVVGSHKGPVTALALSPEGRWLVTIGEDGKVLRWRTNFEDIIDLACRLAGRPLTEAEWRHSLSNLPWRDTCDR